MLIKYKEYLINLNNVCQFYDACIGGFDIKFEFINGFSILTFETVENKDMAFERIIDYYRWQRMVCDLDDLNEKG